ncbi:thioesterase thiol ester dehydrase-isomerase [Pisolithus thermaeus]|nr:thioesterase thiol ester dehydrase-isomerase [Pisolithus thermaeus]
MAACMKFTQRVWKSFIDTKGHDAQCFPNLRILRVRPGVVETALEIQPFNCPCSTVHGGLLLSLTDTLGSLAIASRGHYMTGVSTDVCTSFVRPAGKAGDTLFGKATLTSLGRQLAYTRIDFTNSNGELVAYGTHTKYVGKSATDPKNVKFSDDGEMIVEGESAND